MWTTTCVDYWSAWTTGCVDYWGAWTIGNMDYRICVLLDAWTTGCVDPRNPEKRYLTYEQLKKPARNSDHNDQYRKKPCTYRVKFKVKPINHLEKKKRKRGSKREANGSHQRRARKNGSQSRTELMKIG
ncbi:uncharacterized protein LOC105662166 isoform X3 [Megachile rotundata]|uniref:uncharacterized protein LOC105662166 isoform X3 n=1 Tax=Megachile rotundata TaxID=143995 RepID=UPI003FD64468